MTDKLIFFTFFGAVLALLFAALTAKRVLGHSDGNDAMKKIAGFIKEGANAYLKRQYKVVSVFFLCMFVILLVMAFLGLITKFVPFAFAFATNVFPLYVKDSL